MHTGRVAARSIQISLDEELLREVDRQKESRERGRSAFVRRALRAYLEAQKKREIDRAYVRAYGGRADELHEEFADLMSTQRWPDE